MLLIACAAGGVGYWKYKKNAAKANEAAAQKNLQLTSAVPARTFVLAPSAPAEAAPPLPGAAVPVVPAPAGAAPAPALPGNANAGATMANGKPMPVLDKSGSSLMAVASKSNAGQPGSEGAAPGSGGELGASGGMAEMLTSTRTGTRKAGMLGNRNFILAKGSFIDCALQTRLDSTVPGMTACVITRNVYSDNGKVLLVERGSTVSGEYKSNMKQGMARIFVLWSRIKTPNGVVINLDSPGTDPLGGAGVPGYIDNHFWQRFGGALMLSLVDDVARGITSNSGSGGNSQFNFNSTGDATQNMAAEALKNTINIPPTLYKNQGEQVGIYIARDLDFSSVYDVAAQ
ncbi:MAG: type IV secretion system protein VirB10 [Gallionella sp.]|nr:type IV secretion system protein VirB10 [Gallionella sp.]